MYSNLVRDIKKILTLARISTSKIRCYVMEIETELITSVVLIYIAERETRQK